MTDTHYAKAVDALENGWGTYVARFRRMTPEQQTAFLEEQGYARLADLLGHVIAWWGNGLERMKLLLAEPSTPPQEYDVDAFNARAVAAVQGLSESEVVALFESRRQQMLDFLRALPPGELERNPGLSKRLHVEVVSHLREHGMGVESVEQ